MAARRRLAAAALPLGLGAAQEPHWAHQPVAVSSSAAHMPLRAPHSPEPSQDHLREVRSGRVCPQHLETLVSLQPQAAPTPSERLKSRLNDAGNRPDCSNSRAPMGSPEAERPTQHFQAFSRGPQGSPHGRAIHLRSGRGTAARHHSHAWPQRNLLREVIAGYPPHSPNSTQPTCAKHENTPPDFRLHTTR